MDRLHIYIVDIDSEYANAVADYLERKNPKILCSVIPKEDEIDSEYLKPCVFICDERYIEKCSSHDCIVLSMNINASNKENYFYKYDKTSNLYSLVMDLFLKFNESIINNEKLKSHIIMTYSILGQSGKTSIALAMSRLLALDGFNTLYINLENVSSHLFYLNDDESSIEMTKFIYEILYNKKVNIQSHIEEYSNKDNSGFSYFRNKNAFLSNLNQKQQYELLNSIIQSNIYEYIIFDCPTYISMENDISEWLINISDVRLDIIANTELDKYIKEKMTINPVGREYKTQDIEVLNKSRDLKKSNQLTIKYIEEDNSIQSKKHILNDKSFMADCKRIKDYLIHSEV